MDAKKYYEKYGKDKVAEVAEAAGTTFAYFQHLTTGYRHPSRKLALRLEEASGGEMTAGELLLAPVKK